MGAYLSESFVGGAGHIHAVKIMYLAVLYHFAINIMVEFVIITLVAVKSRNHSCECKILVDAHVARSKLFYLIAGIGKPVLGVEDGRLIHIVPEALYAKVCESRIFSAEPVSCLGLEEIGKMNSSGPYCTHKILTLGVLAEIVVFHTLLVNVIAVLYLNACVDYGNKMYALQLHIVGKLFKVREALLINGEILVALHIVDIQINAVEGNACFLVFFGNGADILLIPVAPAALTVSESPERRDIAPADKLPELLYDVLFVFACDDIYVNVILFGLYLHKASFGVADVKLHSAGIIEKCTEGLLSADDYKVVRAVKRTGILVMIGIIVVPAHILPASFVDATYLLAQTIYDIVLGKSVCEHSVFDIKIRELIL